MYEMWVFRCALIIIVIEMNITIAFAGSLSVKESAFKGSDHHTFNEIFLGEGIDKKNW